MLHMVKKPGGAVYALFVALLLSMIASGFEVRKSMEYLDAAVSFNDAGTMYWEKSLPFIFYAIVLCALLFYLGSEYGLLAVVAAELAFLMLFYISVFTQYFMSLMVPLFLAALALAYVMRDGSTILEALSKLGIKSSGLELDVIYGLGGFFAALLMSIAIGTLFSIAGADDSTLVQGKIYAMPLLVLAWAVFVSPIGEEIFFRGLLLQKIGAIASSALFALMHVFYGSYVEIAGAFCIAVVFCYLARQRRGLVAPIIAHSLFNAFSIFAAFYL